jgi:hypothetical protein
MNVLKAIGILAMGLLLTLVVFPWMDALRDTVYHPVTPSLRQYVSIGDDQDITVVSDNWAAQTFTVTSSYSLSSVKVKVWHTAGTGTLTVALYNANGSGFPTGSALKTGILAASTLSGSVPGAFATVTYTTVLAVTSGTYDVVLHYAGTGVVNWRAMSGGTGYSYSTDAGATWFTGGGIGCEGGEGEPE